MDIRRASELTPATVERFVEVGGWTNVSTRQGMLAALRSICSFAAIRGYVPAHPFAGDTGRKVTPPGPALKEDPPKAEDVARLWACLAKTQGEERRLFIAVACAISVDLTRREFFGLRWGDLDLEGRRIHVRGREAHLSRYARPSVVAMPAELVEILRAWLPFRRSEYVIPGARGTTPWNGTNGRRPLDDLKDACRAAGIEPLTFEDLNRFHRYHRQNATEVIGPLATIGTPGASGPLATIGTPGASELNLPELNPREPSSPEPRSDWLVLGPDEHTPPIVLGKTKERLSWAAFRVVKALYDAGPDGLHYLRLAGVTGDARAVLVRLQRDPDWKAIVRLPGLEGRGQGYRLIPPPGWDWPSR
jgi:hypothetical protein